MAKPPANLASAMRRRLGQPADRLGATEDDRQHLLGAGLVIPRDTGGFYDRFRDRIMFPIRDSRGRIIAFGGRILDTGEPKYLNSPETPLFHKGRELYGLYEARRAERKLERLLVVEGYMDVVMLAAHGIRNAVGTLGTATTSEHLRRLFGVPESHFLLRRRPGRPGCRLARPADQPADCCTMVGRSASCSCPTVKIRTRWCAGKVRGLW